MTDRETMQQALEALNDCTYDEEGYCLNPDNVDAILALRERLAQPGQWQGLTDEEIKEIIGPWGETPIKGYTRKLFDQIEAKLKEKNT